jgi:hypothetical protein
MCGFVVEDRSGPESNRQKGRLVVLSGIAGARVVSFVLTRHDDDKSYGSRQFGLSFSEIGFDMSDGSYRIGKVGKG